MTTSTPPIEEDVLYEFLRACAFELNPSSNTIRCTCESLHLITQDSPLLTFPGGQFGFLLGLFLTSYTYGFEVDIPKGWKTICGYGQSKSAKDYQDGLKAHLAECRFMYQLLSHPEAFDTSQLHIDNLIKTIFGDKQIDHMRKSSSKEYVQAILLWESDRGLIPHHRFDHDGGAFEFRALVIHKSLLSKFLREISSSLVSNKAVTLYKGLDAEYLHEILSETCESLMLAYLFREYPSIPMYVINSFSNSEIKITSLF